MSENTIKRVLQRLNGRSRTAKKTIRIKKCSTKTESRSPFLMHEQESQHPLCSFYSKPSNVGWGEKKQEERKEEIEKRGENRVKTDGDRWAKRQVRKEGAEKGEGEEIEGKMKRGEGGVP